MDLEDSRPKSKNNWAALAALNFRRKNYDEQKGLLARKINKDQELKN